MLRIVVFASVGLAAKVEALRRGGKASDSLLRAFAAVALVGAFFIDMSNALVISVLLAMFG